MAPSTKSVDGRRKSAGKLSLIVTLNVPSTQLRDIISPVSGDEEVPVKETKDSNDSNESSESKDSPDTPNTPAAPTNVNSTGDNASDSNAATPAAEDTAAPSSMGPPVEGAKKKGVKRSADKANGTIDGIPKPRGKPGPKKKPRLEDGTIDHAGMANKANGIPKLGPKANQGAINAGLRALDRSGKPCRKWAKGGFTFKSFTGVVWAIPRWTAPPRKDPEADAEDSAVQSAESSNKENNKENGPEQNSIVNSNNGADVEMQSAPSVHISSPAPISVAAAS